MRVNFWQRLTVELAGQERVMAYGHNKDNTTIILKSEIFLPNWESKREPFNYK